MLVTEDPAEAVEDADAVYTDAWASMGQEAEHAERAARFAGYAVDERLMGRARPHAVFLHCLPAHRGEEVAAEVIDGPQSDRVRPGRESIARAEGHPGDPPRPLTGSHVRFEPMSSVTHYEVSPRDGLQNEPEVVPTDAKVQPIERLVAAGMKDIEVTSFVRPTWIPQLSDATELVPRLPKSPDVRYWGLVPNRVGLDRALSVGLRHIATFMSASETHNKKNVNRTRRESLAGLREVIGLAKDTNVTVRAYISTSFGCPYEGDVNPVQVVELAKALEGAGADTIVLGDTTGMGTPLQVKDVIERVVNAGIPLTSLAIHLHDTQGTALVNAYAAYEVGLRTFDGSDRRRRRVSVRARRGRERGDGGSALPVPLPGARERRRSGARRRRGALPQRDTRAPTRGPLPSLQRRLARARARPHLGLKRRA